MIHYIVYALDSGVVLRAGVCQDSDLELQAHAGEGVIGAPCDAAHAAERDLEPLRAWLSGQIDSEADATPGPPLEALRLAAQKALRDAANVADMAAAARVDWTKA